MTLRRFLLVLIVASWVTRDSAAPVKKRDIWSNGLANFLFLLSTTESPTTTTTNDGKALAEAANNLIDDYFGLYNGSDIWYEQYLENNELVDNEVAGEATTKQQTTTKTSTTTKPDTTAISMTTTSTTDSASTTTNTETVTSSAATTSGSTTTKPDTKPVSVTTTSTTESASTTTTLGPAATSTTEVNDASAATESTTHTASQSTTMLAATSDETASTSVQLQEVNTSDITTNPFLSSPTQSTSSSNTKAPSSSTSVTEMPVTDTTVQTDKEKKTTTAELTPTSPEILTEPATSYSTASMVLSTAKFTTEAIAKPADNSSVKGHGSFLVTDDVTTTRTMAGTKASTETTRLGNQFGNNATSLSTDETTETVTTIATDPSLTKTMAQTTAVVVKANGTAVSDRDMNITTYKPQTAPAGSKPASPISTVSSTTALPSSSDFTSSLQNDAAAIQETSTVLTTESLSTKANSEHTKSTLATAPGNSAKAVTKAQSKTTTFSSAALPTQTPYTAETSVKTSTSKSANPETTSNESSARFTTAILSSFSTLRQTTTSPKTDSTLGITSKAKSTVGVTAKPVTKNPSSAKPISITSTKTTTGTVDFGWVFWNQGSEEADSTTLPMTTSDANYDFTPFLGDRGSIDEQYDYDWLPSDYGISTSSTPVEVDGVALAFFKLNWYWILIGLVIIIIIFCVPGMLMQIYCHKFYIFYRREKDKSKPDLSISEEHTDSTMHDSNEGGGVKTEVVDTKPAAPVECEPPAPTQPQGPDTGFSSGFPSPPDTAQLNAQPPPETHRVDVYTGPCSLPSLNNATSSAAPPVLQQPIAPPQVEMPQEPSFMYPSLNYQYRLENPIPLVTSEPIVYSIPVKEPTNVHGENMKQGKTFGDEAIIDSNNTRRKKHESSKDRPPLRVPKPAEYSAPARPPKPKQYLPDEPVPKSSNYRDYRRSGRRERPWAERKKRTRPKEQTRPGRKIIVNNPRGNDYGPGSNPGRRKKSDGTTGTAREPRSREELLRQLIKGFNEAEMLQRKLDRTRRWTKEQKSRQSKSGRREGEGNSGARNNGKHGTDKPPRYEDVMSDASKNRATKSKRRSHGARRAAS